MSKLSHANMRMNTAAIIINMFHSNDGNNNVNPCQNNIIDNTNNINVFNLNKNFTINIKF